MWQFLFLFAAIGSVPMIGEGLASAPFDIDVGEQVVDLRKPLIARRAGARLVLYVRDAGSLDVSHTNRLSDFEAAVPHGSVVAKLIDDDGQSLTLEHHDYSYFRGYAGLVLSAPHAQPHMDRYVRLVIEAKVALTGVRLVWLDRGGRRVEDVVPSL